MPCRVAIRALRGHLAMLGTDAFCPPAHLLRSAGRARRSSTCLLHLRRATGRVGHNVMLPAKTSTCWSATHGVHSSRLQRFSFLAQTALQWQMLPTPSSQARSNATVDSKIALTSARVETSALGTSKKRRWHLLPNWRWWGNKIYHETMHNFNAVAAAVC